MHDIYLHYFTRYLHHFSGSCSQQIEGSRSNSLTISAVMADTTELEVDEKPTRDCHEIDDSNQKMSTTTTTTTKPPTTSTTKKSPLPVDRGWAWVIMLCACLNVTLIMTFIRSTALLFLHFLDKYQESATMTTLAFGLSSAMFAISNILGPTILLPRFQVRTLTVTGTIINFLCIIGIAFAPHMALIDVLMAILGFSHGFITVPQMTLVGHYFKKRLSFATAFVNLGLSIATMAGPPLTQLLLDTYGLQGAILILAGLNAHCIPASFLFRPVSEYAPLSTDDSCVKQNGVKSPEEADNLNAAPSKIQTYKHCDITTHEELVSLTSHSNADEHSATLQCANGKVSYPNRTARIRSASECYHNDNSTETPSDLCNRQENNGLTKSDVNIHSQSRPPRSRSHSLVNSMIDAISLSSSIRYLNNQEIPAVIVKPNSSPQGSIVEIEIQPLNSKDLQHPPKNTGPKSENFSQAEINIRSHCEKSSHLSLHLRDDFLPKYSRQESLTCFQKLRQSMSSSIYTHPLSIMLLLASGLGIHTQACIAYMPATGKENGLTDSQIPLLVTVIGISDLVSKLSLGVFADLQLVKRIHIPIVTQFFAGTLLQFLTFFKGFGLMMALQVMCGFTLGVLHVMLPVITVDILGLQHMGHIMAGYFLINGVITSIDHVTVGYFKDMTGSFLGAYHYMGSLMLLTALILLLEPLIARCVRATKL